MEKNTQNSGTKEIGSCHARLLIDSSVAERLWSHLCVKLLLTLHAPFAIKKKKIGRKWWTERYFRFPCSTYEYMAFPRAPCSPNWSLNVTKRPEIDFKLKCCGGKILHHCITIQVSINRKLTDLLVHSREIRRKCPRTETVPEFHGCGVGWSGVEWITWECLVEEKHI